MNKLLLVIGAICLVGVGVWIFVSRMPPQREIDRMAPGETVQKKPAEEVSKTALANPASENCVKSGGKLEIRKRGDGGEFGLCQFEDNRACEEWALMRGQCPIGGVKTTGFDKIEENYCAWLGGKTLAVANASCTLPNGKTCSDTDLYNGKCN